jgi:hypothetical protein
VAVAGFVLAAWVCSRIRFGRSGHAVGDVESKFGPRRVGQGREWAGGRKAYGIRDPWPLVQRSPPCTLSVEGGCTMVLGTASQDEELREMAIKRLKKRRDFSGHLLVYVLVNAFLVVIWAVTNVHGFFWPVFPIVGWGIGVVMNAWDAFRYEEFGEERIRREVERLQRQR